MDAFIDGFIDYTCARLVRRFTRRTTLPHPTAAGTRDLSQQGTANFITSLDNTKSPKVTAFAFNLSYGRHLAAERSATRSQIQQLRLSIDGRLSTIRSDRGGTS